MNNPAIRDHPGEKEMSSEEPKSRQHRMGSDNVLKDILGREEDDMVDFEYDDSPADGGGRPVGSGSGGYYRNEQRGSSLRNSPPVAAERLERGRPRGTSPPPPPPPPPSSHHQSQRFTRMSPGRRGGNYERNPSPPRYPRASAVPGEYGYQREYGQRKPVFEARGPMQRSGYPEGRFPDDHVGPVGQVGHAGHASQAGQPRYSHSPPRSARPRSISPPRSLRNPERSFSAKSPPRQLRSPSRVPPYHQNPPSSSSMNQPKYGFVERSRSPARYYQQPMRHSSPHGYVADKPYRTMDGTDQFKAPETGYHDRPHKRSIDDRQVEYEQGGYGRRSYFDERNGRYAVAPAVYPPHSHERSVYAANPRPDYQSGINQGRPHVVKPSGREGFYASSEERVFYPPSRASPGRLVSQPYHQAPPPSQQEGPYASETARRIVYARKENEPQVASAHEKSYPKPPEFARAQSFVRESSEDFGQLKPAGSCEAINNEDGEIVDGVLRKKRFSPIVFDLDGGMPPSTKIGRSEAHGYGSGKARFFIARCNYYDMLAKTKREKMWRAPEYIVERIRRAVSTCETIYMFFTVHGTQYFQGVASLDNTRKIELPSAMNNDRLARVPLCWIHLADVPFYVVPNVNGMIDKSGSIRESFEVPFEPAEKLMELFERFRLGATLSLSLESEEQQQQPSATVAEDVEGEEAATSQASQGQASN